MRLSQFPYVVVRLGCRRCARHGAYRLARLADRYGAEVDLVSLLAMLSADCRLRETEGRSPSIYERCGAYYRDLSDAPRPPDLPGALAPPRLRVVRAS